jgi:hypothetical protein
MRTLARLASDGITGRGLDAMALSLGLPFTIAAVAADAFKKVRRSMNGDSLRSYRSPNARFVKRAAL